jgi:hypothetical protein
MRPLFQPGSMSMKQRACANIVPSLALAAVLLGLSTLVAAEQGSIAIELNKLESQDSQCRTYFVINNKNSTNYQELKLDLVLFRPDGVIGRRFTVDLAPLKADKRTVKLFVLTDTSCNEVGSFLINDVIACKAESGSAADCLKDITVSSLTNVPLTK